jgi:programmed cell death 6-interacting protein
VEVTSKNNSPHAVSIKIMLGIGFKVSDTPAASVQRPLGEFLRHEYAGPSAGEGGGEGGALSTAQEDALAQFAQLKTDVDLVRTPSAVSRHVRLRYYAQLERMAQRFHPRGSSGGSGAGDSGGLQRLQFTWNDSFCPRKRSTQSGLAFERAAVLFNYGALESQLGVQTDRSSPDGLKAACRHFMMAAGAFQVVRDELVEQTLGARTPDMSAEGLGLLTTLMLAQAQACFYEKAIKDQMKDAIKAKLVHQALEFYVAALDFCNSSALAGTIDRSWGVHLLFQVLCMKAATQYWQAKAAKEAALARGVGYGEEIARLTASDAECQEAIKVATQNKLPAPLLQSAQALQRVVREHLAAAHKDNASVYLENVPRLSDLPPVGKVAMVKPLVLTSDEIAQELNGVDLFEQFVSKELLQRAEAVKGDVEAVLKACGERVASTNDEVKLKLSALGLPASIEAFEKTSDNGVPVSVWQRIQHVQAVTWLSLSGGDANPVASFIQQRLRENEASSDGAERKLHGIETRLGQEEIDDNVSRQNYGAAKWTRPTSASLNSSFRADVDRYYRLVKEAKQSDDIVRSKLAASEELLALLSRTKPSLDHEIPALEQDQSSCKDEIGRISELLLRLGQLVGEKDQLLSDFKASFDKFNALPLLLSNGKGAGDSESALQAEKQFFHDHFEGKLAAICKEEQSVLGSLVEVNKVFEARKQHDPVLTARQSFLQRLSDGVDVFEQLESHLKEGNRFYGELTARIAQLHQTVEDHCSARELEKRELELGLKADEEMRQREVRDAELAHKMMSDLQLGGGTYPRGVNPNDEALARQLAGNTPQQYQGSPASYDYAQLQPPPPQQQWGNPTHAYGSYQQSQFGGGNPLFSSAGASAPPPPAYGNYYAQQQQQQQQPPGGGYSYSQYPGQQPPRDSV